jgi:GAF domain-containing protein
MKLPTALIQLTRPRQEQDVLHAPRERILASLLWVMCIVGLFLLGNYTILSLQEQRWTALAIFGFIYVWTVLAAVIRRLPYRLRVYSLMSILYILGTVSFLQDGLQGNGRVYLIALSVVTGILLGVRAGIGTILLSGATLGAVLFTGYRGLLPTWEVSELPVDFLVLAGLAFISAAVLTTVSVAALVNALNRSTLEAQEAAEELEKERQKLEYQVRLRTFNLERRVLQIRTAAEISQAINTLLDQDELLDSVVDLLKERFNLYYVGAFLLDDRGEQAYLRAATGVEGEAMLAEGYRLAVGGASMIGWATANKKARIALDAGKDAVRFSNPHLPLTRSELALPLVSAERVLGALTIQSNQAEAFDEDDITVLQSIADSLATALVNARLFTQAQESLEEIRSLHRQYLRKAWSQARMPEQELVYTFGSDTEDGKDPGRILTIPLVLRGQIIGQIELEGELDHLSADEKAYTEMITNEAAIALENVRLLQETQRQAERERLLSEAAGKVHASMNVDDVLKTTLLEAGRILRARSGSIQLDGGSDDSRKGLEAVSGSQEVGSG